MTSFELTLKCRLEQVCVDFSAHWCGPCKAVAPLFAQMAEKYKNLFFLKVDVDANQVPTLHCLLPKQVAWCLANKCYLSAHCQVRSGEHTMLCELQDIAKECAVAALPTFQIFKNGSKVDEVVGADVRALTALLEKHNAACSVFSGKGRTLAGAPGPSCLPTL